MGYQKFKENGRPTYCRIKTIEPTETEISTFRCEEEDPHIKESR